MEHTFPFGQPIRPVKQVNDCHPKKYFILGVYSSAVHVKWYGPDGKIRIRAMAVATEPEIFWKGGNDYVEKVIETINLDKKYGYLKPADAQFNGPSGNCLDDNYLTPLGVKRENVWLCDLLPYSRMNPKQEKALKERYDGFVDIPYNFPPVPRPIADANRVKEIVSELKQSGAKEIILLGDEPIKYFLNAFDKTITKLSQIENYADPLNVTIDDEEYKVTCLVHPRQAARLGASSESWNKEHQKWITEQSSKIKCPSRLQPQND